MGKAATVPRWGEFSSGNPRFNIVETLKSWVQPAPTKSSGGQGTEEAKPPPSRALSSPSTLVSSNRSNITRKHLSEAEINRRRELGLCFKCEEKFEPNHMCKNKRLQLIVLEEDPS